MDHAIRKDSINDKIFVESLCKELNVPFFSQTLNPSFKPKKDSPEQWAREKRYEYLSTLSIETKSDWIVTGHHCNDNAETVLMNLSRQAGVNGLSGIPLKNGKIIRPLLPFEKSFLCDFVEESVFPLKMTLQIQIYQFQKFYTQKVLKPWN